jgi:hypothetical protein
MEAASDRRAEIYDYFHANQTCQQYFYDPTHEAEHVAYYNSMYLLQDTIESLWWHRRQGFSKEPMHAYIEFWGIMQAVFIQQDSIREIFQLMTGTKLHTKNLPAWSEIRELRNICAGHPARKDVPETKPLTRSFMGRMFGDYTSLKYEKWEEGAGRTFPEVKLGALLDAYAAEAESKLADVLTAMRARWP